MGKYILFAATKRDGSCRSWHKGDWRATKYVLYSDGTCYRTMECVETPPDTEIFRMDAGKLERMKDLLENQFGRTEDRQACDATWWEMHYYAASGRHLHSFRGYVNGVGVLEEIQTLLEKRPDTSGMKLYCGGQAVTKEQVEKAISDYEEKVASPEFQKEPKEAAEFLASPPKVPPVDRRIEYYEFPNGDIVKSVQSDGVYRFDPVKRTWEIDRSLTAEFAWDRPYGETCENLRQKADIRYDLPPFPHESAFKPGNTVLIGAYPQKSLHDFSPISWIVLETTGTTALCIARDCLITSGYCDPKKAYGKPELLWWENSLAREVCNHHFFDNAFSETEKARIVPRALSDVQLGAKCVDPVFLLSEREVLQYFPDCSQRKAKPTPYAIQKGAFPGWGDANGYTCWWILPEENAYGCQDGSIYPKAVFYMGKIGFHGRNGYHTDFTIRPCIQIQYASK